MRHILKLSTLLASIVLSASAYAAENKQIEIPVVGCASDGQVTSPAPANSTRAVQINPALAHKLAFYQADGGPIVLGPRGWHCFGLGGSNGDSLFVTPDALSAAMVLSSSWSIKGDGLQISSSYGDTSGRFTVASIAARVFPNQKAYVQRVINEDSQSAGDYPYGPYPSDEMTYINDVTLTYKTPAKTKGLGTRSMLEANGDPITGAAILNGPTPDLIKLSIRISKVSSEITDAIIDQAIQDAKME